MCADLPPEILFHRFFQLEEHGPARRAEYRGRLDLEPLDESLRDLLILIQRSMNESLARENRGVPEHVEHPPFHFDFIDSETQNAIAFSHGGFSFIGMTAALIRFLWATCDRLSRSSATPTVLASNQRDFEALHAVLFQIQLFFIAAHEYTHHVHGHVVANDLFSAEIESVPRSGGMDAQAREIDADGYAAYHVLANLIDGGHRGTAIRLLGCENQPPSVQDEILFSAFVLAVGAFMFARRPVEITDHNVSTLTHPPQAARMNCLMYSALGWCKQNRPALEAFMTHAKFQALMNVAAEATGGMNGGRDWATQNEFLRSTSGSEYRARLDELVKAHVQSLS